MSINNTYEKLISECELFKEEKGSKIWIHKGSKIDYKKLTEAMIKANRKNKENT